MKRITYVLLGVILSIPAFCATWFEVGALWHDGGFAPFACLSDGKLAVGLMRDGTGFGDDRSVYLVWVEARMGPLGVMSGRRINLFVKESLTVKHKLTFTGYESWPFWGWWIGWRGAEGFARLGQIFTWHGEGFALWPMAALGIFQSSK